MCGCDRCWASSWRTLLLVVCLLLGAAAEPPAAADGVAACAAPSGGGVLRVPADCTWGAAVPGGQQLSVLGARAALGLHSSASATPTIRAGGGSAEAAPSEGSTTLVLQRLVLAGFQLAPPGASQPLFWPHGLVAGAGDALNATDVRFVVQDAQLFGQYLGFFNTQKTLHWTDNTSVLHIHQWGDARTQLRSVGLLLAPAPAAAAGGFAVANCLVAATNASLVPALLSAAALATPAPLLVYVTSNVTLGVHPRLPVGGVVVRRPVVFVGLESLPTSVDLEMVVNQLNLTTSEIANTTFVGLVLENLAPGDSVSSATAAPLSITVTNNCWAVLYNRSIPNEVRWALNNVTLVLSQESEMSYVIYMFTLFTSPLPYLRQQTAFYSDVMHVNMLQFVPGPGSQAITVNHLRSWYHSWGSVVLTVRPVVAEPLPLPVRPLMLTSSTRASPLVQAVRTPAELKANAQTPVIGGREHILLFLSDVSLPSSTASNSSGSPDITVASPMSWIGYSAGSRAAPRGGRRRRGRMLLQASPAAAAGRPAGERDARVHLGMGYNTAAVVLPQLADRDVLQLQQLVLCQLPQGRGAASELRQPQRGLPGSLATLMLWSFDRPPPTAGYRALNMDGVTLLLPEPELDFYQAFAQNANAFVVELGGSSSSLTFEDASLRGPDGLQVGVLTGPGFVGTNVTLRVDPDTAAMPGGHLWPSAAQLQAPSTPAGSSHQPPWVTAVVAVGVTLAALLLAVVGFLWWHRRRLCLRGDQVACSGLDESSHISSKALSMASYQTCGPGRACKPYTPERQGSGSGLACGGMPRAASAYAAADDASPTRAAAASLHGNSSAAGGDVAAQRDAAGTADSTSSLQDNVAAGMQRWRAAVSSTTMLLMERRMDAAAVLGSSNSSSLVGGGSAKSQAALTGGALLQHGIPEHGSSQSQQQAEQQQQLLPPASPAQQQPGEQLLLTDGLVLQELLGSGSFGSVFAALWRGKRVAVKVMQLPASALLEPVGHVSAEQQQQEAEQAGELHDPHERRRRQRQQQQQRQNSPPHMAIMEAVVSSTMSFPNVVQVYTYMLTPLMAKPEPGEPAEGQGSGGSSGQDIAGWSVRLVMELCDEGSLREALDCGLLGKPGGFLAPSTVLTLAHDVAAAMAHLHAEGIIHGDLKAGNVMLTSAGASSNGSYARVWAGDRPLIAKVADFGLATPLSAGDSHATLLARGTPTHMSPELFTAGHISKASDVFAYGVLLFEIMTGQRAYAGVPIPLLPHEVAVQGLRPQWPPGMPPGCRDLRRLAEACWAHNPQDRPAFADILQTLDCWAAGGHGWPPAMPAAAATSTRVPAQQERQQPAAAAASQQQQQQRQGEQPRQQQQQPAPTPGQAQQGAQGTTAADAPAGRNLHMSWSEVDFTGAAAK